MGLMLAGSLARLPRPAAAERGSSAVTLLFCGDVMTGRGIDQILGHPGNPELHESYAKHAGHYVTIAEARNGPIPKPAAPSYIWGDALDELNRHAPDLRIVNLETTVTQSNEHWRGKEVLYRMHPANVSCLTAAKLDCCTLANNHSIDWGRTGLTETLRTVRRAGMKTAGAGRDHDEAAAPATYHVARKGRVIVFAVGAFSSGIPFEWRAREGRAGVHLVSSLSAAAVTDMAARVRRVKQPRDLVVVSIHWGPNWGYDIPAEHRHFAHGLIDEARVDIVFGHSSHHPLGIEVHHGRPILYGCGDMINDYEGIRGHEEFRSDLALAYLVTMDPATGRLAKLVARPFQRKRFRLNRASREDAAWLAETLNREGRALGTTVELKGDHTLEVR
jgi:poly-gamma-glutamate synthesis protein (capsule biosynthesis protein)